MYKLLTAASLAAALAVTPMAAKPAKAGGDTDAIAALLLGAAAIYLIVEATDNDKKEKKKKSSSKSKSHTHSKLLPVSCHRKLHGRTKNSSYFSDTCLKALGYHQGLPSVCKVTYHAASGDRSGYGTRCLMRHGFAIGHHH